MITELILIGLISLGGFLLNLLPTFNLGLPSGLLATVKDVFNGVGYFLPINTLLTILGLHLGFYVFKFVYNMVTETRDWTPGI